jgi:hypothetical protein
VNELKTVNIKGKEYVQVNERIKYFREQYGDEGRINTEILEHVDNAIIIKASIIVNGQIVATGMARERDGDGFINKTSYVENCETSAIGRALGNFGIGIDASVASYEEVANANLQQQNPVKSFDNSAEVKIWKSCAERNRTIKAMVQCFLDQDVDSALEVRNEMTDQQVKDLAGEMDNNFYEGVYGGDIIKFFKEIKG